MEMIWRILVVLVVAAGILAGAVYLAYEVFWKPAELDRIEAAEMEAEAALPPPPHPSLAEFATAKAALEGGDSATAGSQLTVLLEKYPDGPVASDARALLGEINARAFFSPTPGPGKTAYTVVSGDALSKIARKEDSNAALIFRVNNLETINLQIGQVLMIPHFDAGLVVDTAARTLTVLNGGQFFKEYPLLGIPQAAAPGEAKVTGKLATKGEKQIAFGEKEYVASQKTILTTPANFAMRPMAADAESPPPGLALAPADLEEIYLLASPGTPITIR
jgi:LysM repeat protein